MSDNDHPILSLASIKDAIAEGWHLSWDLLANAVMGDIDLDFKEDEEEY